MSRGDFQDMISYLLDVAKLTIWYIDYSLVQATHAAKPQDNGAMHTLREVFRSADCIYTEVKREDIGTSWVVSNTNDEVKSGGTGTAFDMFDILSIDSVLSLDDDDLGHFRVLACEPVAGIMPRPRTPLSRRCDGDESCDICYPDKIVPCVPRSTIKREGSESSSDLSSSDLNLFN